MNNKDDFGKRVEGFLEIDGSPDVEGLKVVDHKAGMVVAGVRQSVRSVATTTLPASMSELFAPEKIEQEKARLSDPLLIHSAIATIGNMNRENGPVQRFGAFSYLLIGDDFNKSTLSKIPEPLNVIGDMWGYLFALDKNKAEANKIFASMMSRIKFYFPEKFIGFKADIDYLLGNNQSNQRGAFVYNDPFKLGNILSSFKTHLEKSKQKSTHMVDNNYFAQLSAFNIRMVHISDNLKKSLSYSDTKDNFAKAEQMVLESFAQGKKVFPLATSYEFSGVYAQLIAICCRAGFMDRAKSYIKEHLSNLASLRFDINILSLWYFVFLFNEDFKGGLSCLLEILEEDPKLEEFFQKLVRSENTDVAAIGQFVLVKLYEKQLNVDLDETDVNNIRSCNGVCKMFTLEDFKKNPEFASARLQSFAGSFKKSQSGGEFAYMVLSHLIRDLFRGKSLTEAEMRQLLQEYGLDQFVDLDMVQQVYRESYSDMEVGKYEEIEQSIEQNLEGLNWKERLFREKLVQLFGVTGIGEVTDLAKLIEHFSALNEGAFGVEALEKFRCQAGNWQDHLKQLAMMDSGLIEDSFAQLAIVVTGSMKMGEILDYWRKKRPKDGPRGLHAVLEMYVSGAGMIQNLVNRLKDVNASSLDSLKQLIELESIWNPREIDACRRDLSRVIKAAGLALPEFLPEDVDIESFENPRGLFELKGVSPPQYGAISESIAENRNLYIKNLYQKIHSMSDQDFYSAITDSEEFKKKVSGLMRFSVFFSFAHMLYQGTKNLKLKELILDFTEEIFRTRPEYFHGSFTQMTLNDTATVYVKDLTQRLLSTTEGRDNFYHGSQDPFTVPAGVSLSCLVEWCNALPPENRHPRILEFVNAMVKTEADLNNEELCKRIKVLALCLEGEANVVVSSIVRTVLRSNVLGEKLEKDGMPDFQNEEGLRLWIAGKREEYKVLGLFAVEDILKEIQKIVRKPKKFEKVAEIDGLFAISEEFDANAALQDIRARKSWGPLEEREVVGLPCGGRGMRAFIAPEANHAEVDSWCLRFEIAGIFKTNYYNENVRVSFVEGQLSQVVASSKVFSQERELMKNFSIYVAHLFFVKQAVTFCKPEVVVVKNEEPLLIPVSREAVEIVDEEPMQGGSRVEQPLTIDLRDFEEDARRRSSEAAKKMKLSERRIIEILRSRENVDFDNLDVADVYLFTREAAGNSAQGFNYLRLSEKDIRYALWAVAAALDEGEVVDGLFKDNQELYLPESAACLMALGFYTTETENGLTVMRMRRPTETAEHKFRHYREAELPALSSYKDFSTTARILVDDPGYSKDELIFIKREDGEALSSEVGELLFSKRRWGINSELAFFMQRDCATLNAQERVLRQEIADAEAELEYLKGAGKLDEVMEREGRVYIEAKNDELSRLQDLYTRVRNGAKVKLFSDCTRAEVVLILGWVKSAQTFKQGKFKKLGDDFLRGLNQ